MSLAEALHDALGIPEPHASEERVQETIAERLEGLASGTTIRRTGYFNHSWAPDLVVQSGEQPERWIYFRFGVRDRSFEDDLRYLASERPFFLDLSSASPDGAETVGDAFILREALAGRGREDVLVTEVPAIDRLEDGVESDREVRAATQQVVLGGHGLLDPAAADGIVANWRRAAVAVGEADVVELREALDSVELFLNEVAAIDLETELRAKWIAGGQPAETFPGREDWRLRERAPWEIARLVLALLEQPSAVKPERWHEIAEAISASTLGHELYQVGTYRQGGAVNELVRAGLSLWTAQYAYVPALEADSLMERFDWAIGDYSLAVNLIRRRAFFTDIGKKWSRVPRATALPPARSRLDALTDAAVLGAGLITPEENVSHELRPTATASLGERLEPYLAAERDTAWRAARITWLELRAPGTSAIAHVDFHRNVVRTTEPIPLRTFVLLVAEFVAGLDRSEMEQLREFLDGA